MKSSKKYYKDLNFVRVFACIAILLYHLEILKGGFLAVSIFFVLSGYLSCISAFRKEKFSLKSYYFNRLIKLYLPLLIVVFSTVAVVSCFQNIIWLNLKPETTSVLFGFNNFWQLSANLDYFAQHINSPFIHLWYISILLQFDIVFPLLFLGLRKLGDKIHHFIPCISTLILSIIGSCIFYYMSINQTIMVSYYNTFSRIFSILFGLSLGFIHTYYVPLIPKIFQNDKLKKIIFFFYISLLVVFFLLIDANSIYFAPSMILVTIISCRLLDYGTTNKNEEMSILDKIIYFFSQISYEMYLFQFPIIFLFQYIPIEENIKIPVIILLILLLSYLLHFCTSKHKKYRILKYICYVMVGLISFYGIYQYCISKDHTKEMQILKEQMAQNEKMNQKKQEEYASQLKKEENDWLSTLEDLENGEFKLKEMVTNLSLVGVGDSVMLGAVDRLYQQFPNGYFDAKVSRTAWVVNGILNDLKTKNLLGNPIILNLGANGDCSLSCKEEILKTIEDRLLFWINVTNDASVHVNENLANFASKYDNMYVIDWASISKGHPEYFYADGIHLTEIGKKEYTKAIYESIYQVYLKKYNQKKEEIIKKHEEEMKSKISFYGNDLLLNAFDIMNDEFKNSEFVVDKDFNYQKLKAKLESARKEKTLAHNVVLILDRTISIGLKEYKELIDLCSGHTLYIISTSDSITEISNEKVINFYQEVTTHDDYLMADKIHLTKKGNSALKNILIKILKK